MHPVSDKSTPNKPILLQQEQDNQEEKDEEKFVQEPKDKEQTKAKKNRKKRFYGEKRRKVGRWYLGETLGKGGFSWVKKGYDRQDGRIVALKFTSKAKGNWSDSQTKQVQNEIEALRQIKHKNVLQLLAYNLNAKYPQQDGTIIPTVLLVLEYLPGGELFDILRCTHALKENMARTYFNQLIDGLTAYHSAGICHRDIKPQNLLLDSHFALKIADFGLAKVFGKDDENLMRTFYVGTQGYQAPEILNKDPYLFECDIFSCGVVLFILLAGYPPFEQATTKCRWYAPLLAGNARQFWKQHRGCGIPSAAKDLITRMVWYDKNKRITISRIKKHKWYNGERLSAKQSIKELKTLYHKKEIERRYDAAKQAPISDSVYRGLGLLREYDVKSVVLVDDDKQLDNYTCNEKSEIDKILKNGDTIYNCSEIFKVVIKSIKANTTVDCTGNVVQKFYNKQKRELYCDNIVSTLIEMYGGIDSGDKFQQLKKIEQAGDAVIIVDYSQPKPESIPVPFPEDDMIGFKDVYTQLPPRYTLEYIQKVLINSGGMARLDLKNCSIETKLATHNFPTPVTILISMYCDQNYNAYIVRFKRISGDVLHCQRVLRSVIPRCGYVLTGLSDQQYNAVEPKQKQNDEFEYDSCDSQDIDCRVQPVNSVV